jgi:predicted AAA+ superfamily ATPase
MIDYFPITAILGARQVGKSTLARELENPQLALENLQGLIVIDDVQWAQNLFPYLRYLVDQKKQQKFLLLGSASGNLINQSSESLAGHIGPPP